jgi:hypothetical protein
MASIPASLMDRVARNRTRGQAARLYLRRNIATFPISELAKLPRSTLKRIDIEPPSGPTTGRTTNARPSAPARNTATKLADTARPGEAKRQERTASLLELLVLRVIVIVALTVTATSAERPARWLFHHLGFATGEQMGLCLRLDTWSDDCRFEIRTEKLSLSRVGELTGIPLAMLAADNSDLSSTDPLPTGVQVRIKRTGDQNE